VPLGPAVATDMPVVPMLDIGDQLLFPANVIA
jgi:hypothetical protein